MRTRSNHGPGRSLLSGVTVALALVTSPAAWAGGTPENLLVIIDPSNNDSLYIGNYYKDARDIPDSNVLYMVPDAANYSAFVDYNLEALFGTLANAAIEDHIDYIVVMPGAPYRINASGLVHDNCASVNRFAISSTYTMAFIADEVLSGTLWSTEGNRYFSTSNDAYAFDSSVAWLGGQPSESPYARRYFIGTMLGYSGERGNTPDEIIAMIDRSVAVDGTRPEGTFYFMNNEADPLRNVRAYQYGAVVTTIMGLGGQAEIIDGVLPIGRHDCLGIMTGAASPPIDSADMTVLPGAFCDHMTSYAAHFDTSSQTKLSRWIVKGATGSWGAVEEPCNYVGKFPHARLHLYYFKGSSLGEAAFRSAQYVPFQMLLYGDPMTRPFAHLPSVTVDDAPTEPVSGTIVLTPTATTSHPTAEIEEFDLLIDGVLYDTVLPGESFTVDTVLLADGWHDLRVLAYDDTLVKSTGRWIGALIVDNHGRSVTLDPSPLIGNWTTPFDFDIAASGGEPSEVRLVQNGRVVAGTAGSSATLTVYGLTLGAGPVRVQAEALFAGNRIVLSAPIVLDVDFTGDTPSGQPPVAFDFTKRVRNDSPFVVELPATFDDTDVPLTFEILSGPTKTDVPPGQTGPYRLMYPWPDAHGLDAFTFHVKSSIGNSNEATVTLDYGWPVGDLNCDGDVDFDDINPFVLALSDPQGYEAAYPDCDIMNGDINGDGIVDFGDINPFVALLSG